MKPHDDKPIRLRSTSLHQKTHPSTSFRDGGTPHGGALHQSSCPDPATATPQAAGARNRSNRCLCPGRRYAAPGAFLKLSSRPEEDAPGVDSFVPDVAQALDAGGKLPWCEPSLSEVTTSSTWKQRCATTIGKCSWRVVPAISFSPLHAMPAKLLIEKRS